MNGLPTANVDLHITDTSVTLAGAALDRAGPVSSFYAILGTTPSRVIAAGPPAPHGHRNNQIHFYDDLGITLNEHHYTYQVQGIGIVLNPEESIHPTTCKFSGELWVGGVRVLPGALESDLVGTTLKFLSYLPGSWSAEVLSAPINGERIYVSLATEGIKLPSGKRSKQREIVSLSLSLTHDNWDSSCRPLSLPVIQRPS